MGKRNQSQEDEAKVEEAKIAAEEQRKADAPPVNSAGENIDKAEAEDRNLVTAGPGVSLADSQDSTVMKETENGKESKADAKDPNITTVDKDDPETSKIAQVVTNQPDIPDDKQVDGSGDPAATPADAVPNDSNTAKGADLAIERKDEDSDKKKKEIVLIKNISGQDMHFFKGEERYTITRYGRIPLDAIPAWVKRQQEYQIAFKNKDLQNDTI